MYRPPGSSGGSSQQQQSPNAQRPPVPPAFTGYVASTVARSTVTSNPSPAYTRMPFDSLSSTSYSSGHAAVPAGASSNRRPSMLSDFHSIGVDTGSQQQQQRASMITPQQIAPAARPSMIDQRRVSAGNNTSTRILLHSAPIHTGHECVSSASREHQSDARRSAAGEHVDE